MAVDPKARINLIRDPIHNYIPITMGHGSEAGENDLIASRWMQRLRRIHQLQAAWLVYPGATHTRFSHSLGVLHLAGQFASQLYARYVEVFGKDSIPERNHVIETVRLAGLLHDVGHSAFGHSFDQLYTHKHFGKTHEDIGRKIITEELGGIIQRIRFAPDGPFETPIDPAVVARFVKPLPQEEDQTGWEEVFSKIIYGLYSADTMDYLIRDAHFAGTQEYGIVDTQRLIFSSTVTEHGLTLHGSAASALKSYLFSRLMMYENVYYHKTVRSFDMSFCELLSKAVEYMAIGDPTENVEAVFPVDDIMIHGLIPTWASSRDAEKKRIGEEWRALLDRRNPWKEAYRYEVVHKDIDSFLLRPRSAEDLQVTIRDAIPPHIPIRVDKPFLDVRPQNPLAPAARKKSIAVYDPLTQTVDQQGLRRLIHDLPVKFHVLRVFCPAEYKEEVYKRARAVVVNTDSELQESSY